MDVSVSIKSVEECQEIVFEYRKEMKDADYLLLCNNLQYIFLQIQQVKNNMIHARPHRERNDDFSMSSGDCIIFLLNVIKTILWCYSVCVFFVAIYLIMVYGRPNNEIQRHLKTTMSVD